MENTIAHPFPLSIFLVFYQGPQIRVDEFPNLGNRALQDLLRVCSNVEVQGWVPVRSFRTIRIPRSFRAHGRPGLFVNLQKQQTRE